MKGLVLALFIATLVAFGSTLSYAQETVGRLPETPNITGGFGQSRRPRVYC